MAVRERSTRWAVVAVVAAAVWTSIVVVALDGRGTSLVHRTAFFAVAPAIGILVALDLRDRVLPRQISYAALVVFVVLVSVGSTASEWRSMATGAIVMYSIAAILGHRGRLLGRGDVHLCPLLGAMIGWFDPWQVVTAWLVAAIAAACFAVVAMATARIRSDDVFAYGPFLLIGSAVALLVA